MGWNGSTKLVVIAAACLVSSGSLSCCKSYVQANVPACPLMTEAMVLEMMAVMDSPTVDYVADDLIPYCKGIDALRGE